MRILIFSDNHGEKENLPRIIQRYQPLDRIISLGDSEMKEKELSDMDIFGVKGNYPFEPKFPYELDFEFEGWKCYFTHGHLYHVKSGVTMLLEKARSHNYDLVAFGHTHRSFLEEKAGVILLNPGSLSSWRSNENPTFAVVELEKNKIELSIYNIYGNLINKLEKTR